MKTAAARPKGLRLLGVALRSRKAGSMLAFGFSSGLPFALLIGTLTAWLGEAKINLATIGVFSWIGLAYAFKFLWSPLVDRWSPPGLRRLGRRRGWIVLCQLLLAGAFLLIAATDPASATGRFALWAFLGALASATQDVAVDAWRIEVADEATPVELLSAVYQLGYRIASIVGGAFALFLAYRMPWPTVFAAMAVVQASLVAATLAAPDTQRPVEAGTGLFGAAGLLPPRARALALTIVGVSWVWAIGEILHFMIAVLTADPADPNRPSAAAFMKATAPWIIIATVFVPLAVAATINALVARGRHVAPGGKARAGAAAADHAYRALVAPLSDLIERLGWGVLVVIGLILTYAVTYNVWASFAFPFYLDFLHYTKDEVAFASKVFGIVMTILGIGLGAYLFAKVGRFPTVLIGATLPALGNFLYRDLALGGAHLDAVAHLLLLDRFAEALGSDARMVRLLLAIGGENLSTGIAGAAFTAYVSGIVSKRFAAVQYALLASLTFLIGSLGRAVAGQAIDLYGYPTVFLWVAAAGLPAIGFVLLEWWRSTRVRGREAGDTG